MQPKSFAETFRTTRESTNIFKSTSTIADLKPVQVYQTATTYHAHGTASSSSVIFEPKYSYQTVSCHAFNQSTRGATSNHNTRGATSPASREQVSFNSKFSFKNE
ncbi:hypothetical protein JCM33374_g4938 [Metschnikowia sp. JCM 33374]|nr:hypothetical protein JCM33374_g4938 [Metschnikowia sp. JCM 33374]